MKKFQFTLEQLLKVRQREVLQAQDELKKLQDEYTFLKGEICFLEKENHYYKEKIFHNALNAQERSFVPHYLSEIAQVLSTYRINSRDLENRIIKMQNDLLNAVKERKKIEKLKEKQYALWQNQEKHREDHLLDNLYSKKHELHSWMNQK